ncbi:ABC transporter permease [Chelatococcus sp. SYSU_G07232]|uniref:ABC transporter permease n=1 Tax=Chelatococcus albus TaxID=3047466 RepID=A0ABT7ADL1_9HYPH|nr:ABC transporter permease [Chelatococcus sp. SYSU_G07232]MDJ1157433.1 ABC transporter permease [Chelatococcus sp. SYSU_G07232]
MPDTLKRNAPLVPAESTAGRALVTVIAILTFLAALAAGAAELVAGASSEWRSAISREVTIQVRPTPQRDVEADVARAAEIARADPRVAEVKVYSKAEAERLLEPWLGTGLDLVELPVPRLVVVQLRQGEEPDTAALKRALAEAVPTASLDDHRLWIARLAAMAGTVVVVALVIVGLVLTAAALAIAFATRAAVAGNREILEVLHFVGADDRFIAREFQARFLKLGLRGGAIGGAAALLFIIATGAVSASWRASPGGDQLEALFGAFEIGWRGYAAVVAIAAIVAGVTAAVSRMTVARHLRRLT